MSPTARTLERLRVLGCLAESVEKWIPQAKVRRDLFGIGDVIWVHGHEIGLVQATTAAHVAAREAKARANPNLARWLRAGGKFAVWGWSLRGARGTRKVWTLTERELKVLPVSEKSPRKVLGR